MLQVIDRQVRALRSRQAVGSFKLGLRQGTYWGIRSRVADYRLGDALEADPRLTELLADTPTRLKKLDGVHQERLINWRYVTCDTAVRRRRAALRDPAAGLPHQGPASANRSPRRGGRSGRRRPRQVGLSAAAHVVGDR